MDANKALTALFVLLFSTAAEADVIWRAFGPNPGKALPMDLVVLDVARSR